MKVVLTVLPYPLCKNATERESHMDAKYVDPSHMLCVGFAKPLPSKASKGIWQGDSGGKIAIAYFKIITTIILSMLYKFLIFSSDIT